MNCLHPFKTEVVGSNPSRKLDVCAYLFYICVVVFVGRDSTTDCSPFQGVLPTFYGSKRLTKQPRPNIEPLILIIIIIIYNWRS
jgi:hypothetical protein